MTIFARKTDPEDRAAMPTVEDYLRRDGAAPEAAFDRGGEYLDTTPSPKEIYFGHERFADEVQYVWKKVWQFVGRENEIPEVGDFMEYTIADQTVIVVRESADKISAYHNACLHRGTKLVQGNGKATDFICSFHGWRYGLDGKLAYMPCRWDFPDISDVKLQSVRAETWNGMVFVNFDRNAENLLSYIGETIVKHFEYWKTGERWQGARVARVIRCNWKVLLEAFMEVYHVNRTHPQLSPYVGDISAQYDSYGNGHGRMIDPLGVPSPLLADSVDEQGIVDSILGDNIADIFEVGSAKMAEVKEGETARDVIAQFMRNSHNDRYKIDYSKTTISEMIDAYQYFVFPNVMPWAGNMFPELYRILPNGNDPESSVFEVRLLFPVPPGEDRPRDVPLHMLGDDEPWAAATELGELGPVIDQDINNLEKIQLGLHSDGIKEVQFSQVQEGNIRLMHRRLNELIAAGKQRTGE